MDLVFSKDTKVIITTEYITKVLDPKIIEFHLSLSLQGDGHKILDQYMSLDKLTLLIIKMICFYVV